MPTIQELLQEKGNIVAEMRSTLDANPGDKWTADHEAKYVAQNARISEIDAKCVAIRADETTRAERAAALDAAEQRSREFGNNQGGNREQRSSSGGEQRTHDRAAVALQAWLRAGEGQDLTPEHRSACQETGVNPNTREIGLNLRNDYGDAAWMVAGNQGRREIRAGLDVGTSGAGRETIPQGFLAELDRKMLAFGEIGRAHV